jgi:hypothetical protein
LFTVRYVFGSGHHIVRKLGERAAHRIRFCTELFQRGIEAVDQKVSRPNDLAPAASRAPKAANAMFSRGSPKAVSAM